MLSRDEVNSHYRKIKKTQEAKRLKAMEIMANATIYDTQYKWMIITALIICMMLAITPFIIYVKKRFKFGVRSNENKDLPNIQKESIDSSKYDSLLSTSTGNHNVTPELNPISNDDPVTRVRNALMNNVTSSIESSYSNAVNNLLI